jgi:hypothetical protein
MIKKALVLMALLFAAAPRAAKAGEVVPLSTATFCTVAVSTSVTTEVDNFNAGCEGLMNYRVDVKICNPTGNTTINFGYTSAVSSQTASGRLGEELVAAACKEIIAKSNVQIWAISQAASAAQRIVVEQASTSQ